MKTPFRELIPPLSPEEYAGLEENIVSEGCRDAIVVWNKNFFEGGHCKYPDDEIIIDGHNRLEICQKHKIPFKTNAREFKNENEATAWIIRNQFSRRNLSIYDRSVLALRLEEILRPVAEKHLHLAKGKGLQKSAKVKPIDTRAEVARAAGVSHDTIAKVKVIEKKASPELKESLRRGDATINSAYKGLHTHVGQNSGENEWYTPPKFIEAANALMGGIDCDPASTELANKTVGAKVFHDAAEDGLKQPWSGRVWLNPPYAQPLISQFSEAIVKKKNEYSEALILVNNATETEWLQNILVECSGACFIKGRVRFIDSEGKKPGAPLQGQVILYIGPQKKRFKELFLRFGVVFLK